jgi:formyltetrahydrofolate-dependent phosphoribosylglycinamide formyltransferase
VSTPRLAVLVSGGGTTLQNLVDRIDAGTLDAEVCLVVASKPGTKGLQRAARHGIASCVVEWPGSERSAEFDAGITEAVDAARADLVIMGGFLRLWNFPAHWDDRVINIHPALLPAFGGQGMYGHHVHEAVVASGAKVSGCTVHFASREYDKGPIILQRTVPVRFTDTPDDLAARVFAEECEAYPDAIALYGQGRLRIDGGRVHVLPPAAPSSEDA